MGIRDLIVLGYEGYSWVRTPSVPTHGFCRNSRRSPCAGTHKNFQFVVWVGATSKGETGTP